MSPRLHRRGPATLYSALILTPLDRVHDVPIYARVFGLLGAAATLLQSDLLTGLLALLVASGALDYFLGRACAKRAGVYDPLLARAGMLTKLAAIFMLFLIRGFEYWAMYHAIPGIGTTRGGISSALAVGLFVMDLESIEHHRVFLEARPIPGFSRLVAFLRSVERRMLPLPAATPPPPEAAP